MAAYVPTLKTQYKEQIVPALMKEFGYTSIMQCPKLEKIVINQGMGQAVADHGLMAQHQKAADEGADDGDDDTRQPGPLHKIHSQNFHT